ncbi:hypothetical protein OO013_18530 [Mangrovivirga sp. M17]|uniref:Uncharacterized protein n=1 Tax=Mangrovivirga halotolerans TaxID=2993936 RepID=A0ABT3RXM0_9BACT|nr:hypothetical protein [Mangrovivirga halotolerans]MCX2745885.1 hypothetical protein [Mangrovivirga halotolerans]
MQKLFTILYLAILTFGNLYSQGYQPLDLAKEIFSSERFYGIDRYTYGEYQGKPNGTHLAKGVKKEFELLDKNEMTAVVAMTLCDSTGRFLIDTYLHFRNDEYWKMEAFRTLTNTDVYAEFVERIESMNKFQIDSLVNAVNSKPDTKNRISEEDIQFDLENSKLILSSDRELKDYYTNNKEKFEAIKKSVISIYGKGKYSLENTRDITDDYNKELFDLKLTALTIGGYLCESCIFFIIGGVSDNTVGYLYVDSLTDIPLMSPDDFIVLRDLGEGWFLFKTT